ncbi:hypothetical protein ACJMK2_009553 [Sinanodonta woodiana]|uniref:BTB domain-containing protein n=1 Tax=Sinanodonta woodiana TaxID=1069815 RepID=A0ABD3VEX7_SINWO
MMSAANIDWQAETDVLGSNRYMLENHVACDITFYVGKQRQEITAHKYVLVSRSSVFYAMLCGPLQETGQIDMPDIEPYVFQHLLRFMYCEEFEPNGESILALLYAAKKYAVERLVSMCVNWLKSGVTVENVCDMLQQAHSYGEKALLSKCLEFILDNGSSVLQHTSFRTLPSELVEMVVKQDGLCADENQIYEAMKDWAQNWCAQRNLQPNTENMRGVLSGLKNYIRFSLMDEEYFADKVAADDILTADEKVSLFRTFLCGDTLETTNIRHIVRKSTFQSMQRVLRFSNQVSYMSVGSTLHAIELKCSEQVLLMGIIIYGATFQPYEARGVFASAQFASDIEVQVFDQSQRSIVSMKCHKTISEDKLQEILFNKPVVLMRSWYTITLHFAFSGTTVSGKHGEKVVSLGDGQFIAFRDSSLSTNSTNASNGQIPGLVICRRRSKTNL